MDQGNDREKRNLAPCNKSRSENVLSTDYQSEDTFQIIINKFIILLFNHQ